MATICTDSSQAFTLGMFNGSIGMHVGSKICRSLGRYTLDYVVQNN